MNNDQLAGLSLVLFFLYLIVKRLVILGLIGFGIYSFIRWVL